jgi:hypothetical protein
MQVPNASLTPGVLHVLTPKIGLSASAEYYDIVTSKRSCDDKGDIDKKRKRHVRLHRKERLGSKLS